MKRIRENVSDRAVTFARAWWGVEEGRPESPRTGHCGWSRRGGWSLTWMWGQWRDPVCTDSVLPSVKQRIKGVRNEVLVVEGKWKKLRQTGCDSNQKCVSKSILKDRGRASQYYYWVGRMKSAFLWAGTAVSLPRKPDRFIIVTVTASRHTAWDVLGKLLQFSTPSANPRQPWVYFSFL